MTIWADVEVDEHQFLLSPVMQDPSALTGGTDVFDAGPRHLSVITGIASGPVTVGVEVLAQAPGEADPEWENVSQTSLTVSEPLEVLMVMGDIVGDFSAVLGAVSGIVSVRVSTTGRSAERDAIVEVSSERYLVEIWPTKSVGPTKQIRSTDRVSTGSQPAASSHQREDVAADATVRLFGPVKSD